MRTANAEVVEMGERKIKLWNDHTQNLNLRWITQLANVVGKPGISGKAKFVGNGDLPVE